MSQTTPDGKFFNPFLIKKMKKITFLKIICKLCIIAIAKFAKLLSQHLQYSKVTEFTILLTLKGRGSEEDCQNKI